MHDPRRCPICSTQFIPRTINSTACSHKCQRRVEHLRARGREYDQDLRNITLETLEGVLEVREADARVQAQIDAEEALRAAEEFARQRQDEDLLYQQEREWMDRFRELDAQRIARGWKPITIGAAPPDQRRRFLVPIPPRKRN
ncbi:hypothetical protein SAMN04488005_0454 [Yoonia tamlensis]|uniref:Uncharacterized protein n=1 Tax=Yoonia tamlensis TaxID=390270 RepID=A0A1I6FTD5_9RHOB|nr:hypothetical protein SAMN04488005_0454 [Yoonia tamlensis]